MEKEIDFLRNNKEDIRWCLIGAIAGLLILGYLIGFVWTTESDYILNSQEIVTYDDVDSKVLVISVTDLDNNIHTYKISGIDKLDANEGDTIRIKWFKGQFAGYEVI